MMTTSTRTGCLDAGRERGLTLIEVLIALAVIAIGILATLGLQATALQTTRAMSGAQTLTQIGFSELEFQRSIFTPTSTPPTDCLARMSPADIAAGFGCEVVVLDCSVGSTSATCGGGTGNAFLIEVTATRSIGPALTLRRVLGERTFTDIEGGD